MVTKQKGRLRAAKRFALLIGGISCSACAHEDRGGCPLRPVLTFMSSPSILVTIPPDSTTYLFHSRDNNFALSDSLPLVDAIKNGKDVNHGIRVSTASTFGNLDTVTIVLELPTPIIPGSYSADSVLELGSGALAGSRPRWSLVDNPAPAHLRIGFRDVRPGRTFVASNASGAVQITKVQDGFELSLSATVTDVAGNIARLRGAANLLLSMNPGLCVD